VINATGTGQIHVHLKANRHWHAVILQDVLFVPELYGNLLSVTHLTCCGTHILFSGKACHINDLWGNCTCDDHLHGNLYLMEIWMIVPESANMAHVNHFPTEGDALPARNKHALVAHGTTSSTDVNTWHCHLGHLNVDTILQMVCKGMVKGIEISGTSTCTSPCEPYLKGKQT
jgi:gag-pre-integrase-like protein/Pol polyprotein